MPTTEIYHEASARVHLQDAIKYLRRAALSLQAAGKISLANLVSGLASRVEAER